MRKKLYFNYETRIATVDDLNNVPGKIGKRVLDENTGTYYYWLNGTWTAETSVTPNYTSYNCQVFQFNTSNPYDNVFGTHLLETNPTNILWERLDVGVYRGTLEGAFPLNRTQFLYSGTTVQLGLSTSPPISPIHTNVSITRVDEHTIILTQIDSATLEAIDGLNEFNLEIRTYFTNSYND